MRRQACHSRLHRQADVELIHDKPDISLTSIYLPALNTPQLDWARNKMRETPFPARPIYQPPAAARAVVFAASHPKREIWVGKSTLELGFMNLFAPGITDRIMASKGYGGQMSGEPATGDTPGNLMKPIGGNKGAQGRFGNQASEAVGEMWTSCQRDGVSIAGGVLLFLGLTRLPPLLAKMLLPRF